ncbi:PleD family two-component system response regulator [Elusimicrobiota bacterium]
MFWKTTKKVLIVDDEPELLKLLSVIIDKAGYSATTSHTSAGGMKLALKKKFDLIILDVYMPILDGWEVLRQIRSNPETQNTPVIMLTSADTVKDIDKAYSMKANAYMIKPVDPDAFETKVRELLQENKSE